MKHRKIIGQLWVLLIVVIVSSLCIGRYAVPLTELGRILFGLPSGGDATMTTVIRNVRLPRILLAGLIGAALSAAGVCFQSVFQNPMASPDILGASSGAGLGAALGLLCGLSARGVMLSAFVCGIVTIVAVFLIGARAQGKQVVNLILAGIMVGSLCNAGISYIKLVADPTNQLPAITYWLMGSLSGAKWSDLQFFAPFIAVGAVPLLLLRWRINILSLGDDEARTMGVSTDRLRWLVICCATLLTAACVAVCGMIGWVGLVVPNLCRRLVGNDVRVLLPSGLLLGASFLLIVDNVSRSLLATEIPIGILTAFIGAPFFLWMLMRKEKL